MLSKYFISRDFDQVNLEIAEKLSTYQLKDIDFFLPQLCYLIITRKNGDNMRVIE